MKLKMVSRLRNILGITGTIILILVAVGCIVGTYFIGSYIQLYYYYMPRYNSTYNMITGCSLNNTYCSKLSCYEPFYKNCVGSGIFAVLMSILPITMITMILIIIMINCCGCNKRKLTYRNETKNESNINNLNCNINDEEFHTIDLNDNKHELQTICGETEINNNQTLITLDSNETIKLSSSSEISTTKANVSLEYSKSQNDDPFISEIEKTGNMSYSG